ncbi:hypothetical protein CZ771_12560 [Actinomycetales bacterium JB111]|nr:hypothetical protein CZ771_12560 [Actinomycetales bacterium JB111]
MDGGGRPCRPQVPGTCGHAAASIGPCGRAVRRTWLRFCRPIVWRSSSPGPAPGA